MGGDDLLGARQELGPAAGTQVADDEVGALQERCEGVEGDVSSAEIQRALAGPHPRAQRDVGRLDQRAVELLEADHVGTQVREEAASDPGRDAGCDLDHPRLQRALIYVAGAALMLPALHWVGAMITPERALFERELATIGAIGVIAYALLWLEAAWPAGIDLPARACEGMALGAFATVLFGTVIGHAGAASTVAAGLLIGVIQAERGPARARS